MTVGRESAARPTPRLTGHDLDELLTALASARSWTDAARVLLGQLAARGNAPRGVMLMVDTAGQRLHATHTLGSLPPSSTEVVVPLTEVDHPLVVAVTALEAVVCTGAVLSHDGIPF